MQINYLNKLQELANSHKLPHAILLYGNRNMAIDLAGNFARWLFCDMRNSSNSVSSESCECSSCKLFMANSLPDYRLVDLGRDEEIKIDCIREINNFANSRAYLGNRKVLLINNLHNINIQAANAFLKTLEEPLPAIEILFLLVTDYPKRLPLTILSRVFQVNLNFSCNLKDINITGKEIKGNQYNDDQILITSISNDLYNIWVNEVGNPLIIAEKWKTIAKQQLINCLWFIVAKIIKANKNDDILLKIKQKLSPTLLWQLLDSLNYINMAITLGYQVNWQLFLDLFVLTKFTRDNIYGRTR